ncbi:MAG: heavy metal sensor histidine kinase [Candidatus Omnitrophica bacterium]|nr:heavy metal sensor histidine kinase [Candidatus Omnitrophota bacterium]
MSLKKGTSFVSLSPSRKREPRTLDSRFRGNDRKSRSIRTRLLLGYAAALLISMLLISTFLYLQVRRDLVRTMKSFLHTEFSATLDLIQNEAQDTSSMSNFLSRQTLLGKGPYRLNYALFDENGHVIARTEGFSEDLESLRVLERAGEGESYERSVAGGGGKFHLITQSFRNRADMLYFLQFGLDEGGMAGTLVSLAGAVLIAIPVILVLAVTGGFYLTQHLLSPIGKLSQSAREITITNLDKELPLTGSGDELDELAKTFNDVFRRLRESYQRIIRFTADASHELRLPITAVKGQAEVVLSRERSLEEYRKVLGDIIEEFNRLSRMINQLLSLSRADSGEAPLELEQVDLDQLLWKLVDFYQPLADEKEIHLAYQKSAPVLVSADRLRLQELFSNLLENAVKYTHNRGSVAISVKNEEAGVKVSVKDTGIGIPKSEQKKIFERFYRVDKSRSREQGGAGLGLSIAETIARAHRGSISVESEPGKGSTFTVILPNLS